MLDNIKFRTLRADEIECRPQFLSKENREDVKIVLYIDSRAVTNFLDDAVGNLNWQFHLNDRYGTLSIRHPETGEWIGKSDTGEESNISADKGFVSDVYKRCLSRWGVTELYSAPCIKVKNDGYNCQGYRVSRIAYDENRRIIDLEIVDRYGNTKWTMNAEKTGHSEPSEGKSNQELLKEFCSKQKTKPGMNIPSLKKFFEFYTKKTATWQGRLQPEVLFNNWIARERN